MIITELYASGFRCFGEENPLNFSLRPGINLIVGENDSGKTAIVDALRFCLGTRSEDYLRLTEDDFTVTSNGRVSQLIIRLSLSSLSPDELAKFAEWCVNENGAVCLHINIQGKLQVLSDGRQRVSWERKAGKDGEGPAIDGALREFLRSTYLRPLRDAERELSPGRRSRLSQILAALPELAGQNEVAHDDDKPKPTVATVLRRAETEIQANESIQKVENRINQNYLSKLLVGSDELLAKLSLSAGLTLSQILERLELVLENKEPLPESVRRGLGMNNALFMAAELLLLQSTDDQLATLLIEEPEAHLHPQMQVRFMEMLEDRLKTANGIAQTQIIITSHSPLLASSADLNALSLCYGASVYGLDSDATQLATDDYRFLRRFLDATKANLFFARGVLIVEGESENILLPAIAKKLGRSFASRGVSIVNVGHVGLFRYSRIFQRSDDNELLPIPVACVADRDIPPAEAKGLDGDRPNRTEEELSGDEIKAKTANIKSKEGGSVRVFVSNYWTLEYDLAFCGLAEQVHQAAGLVASPSKPKNTVLAEREQEVRDWEANKKSKAEIACLIFQPIYKKSGLSKPQVAEQLAQIIEDWEIGPEEFKELLPPYLVSAIAYVTRSHDETSPSSCG